MIAMQELVVPRSIPRILDIGQFVVGFVAAVGPFVECQIADPVPETLMKIAID
jgi:hypothetical protein